MKHLIIILSLLALNAFGELQAKVVGDTIHYKGKVYYIGPNFIKNSSFNMGYSGWYDGTSTTISGTLITEANWKITASGGVDGNWLMGTTNSGKDAAGSLKTAWDISSDSLYYFSFYISNRQSTNNINTSYQVVSLTNTIGTETKKIIGSSTTYGVAKIASDTSWVQNEIIFDNPQNQYQYLQCCFRWENNAFGFDKFNLAPLLDPTVTKEQLVEMQFLAKKSELQDLENNSDLAEYAKFLNIINNYLVQTENVDVTNINAMNASMVTMDSIQGLTNAKKLIKLVATCQYLINSTSYSGINDFADAVTKAEDMTSTISDYKPEDFINEFNALTIALNTYRLSQNATADNPADYTFMISCPNFSSASENEAESSSNISSLGWINGSTFSGASGTSDIRNAFNKNHTCWNAWWYVNASETHNLDIHQEIKNLPIGIYRASCLAITQTGYLTDQHAYIKSNIGTEISPNMTIDGWDTSTWDSLTTQKNLVTDGNLTIGFTSTRGGNDGSTVSDSKGWWCATHFHLYYYGQPSEEELQSLYDTQYNQATTIADTMHFIADKTMLENIIAENTGLTGRESLYRGISKLNGAVTVAVKSEDKYTEIMSQGKSLQVLKDSITNSNSSYGAAHDIANFAYNATIKVISAPTTSYIIIDTLIEKMKYYVNDYCSAYNTTIDSLNKFTSISSKDTLNNILSEQSHLLMVDTLKNTTIVSDLINKLNNTTILCSAQNIYENNKNIKDYTFMIQNPDAGGTVTNTTGWTINKGKGNNLVGSGQHYNNSNLAYFDSYAATAGMLNYYGYQVITGIPNGIYSITAAARTSGSKGAFIFASNGGITKSDTTWTRIELQTYKLAGSFSTGTDSIAIASDKYGKIWEEAEAAVESNKYTEKQYAQSLINNGCGFGWEYVSVDNINVINHEIVIGMTTDSLKTGEPFTGTWFSMVDFTLTKTADGDNSDWNGPISEIQNVNINNRNYVIEGIYNLSGIKINDKITNLKKGVYILIRGKNIQKIVVK